MNNKHPKTIVNSWNEWDPLNHVIVGRAEGTMISAPEPGMMNDFPAAGVKLGEWGPLPEDLTQQSIGQLELVSGLSHIPFPLQGSGTPLQAPQPFESSSHPFGQL